MRVCSVCEYVHVLCLTSYFCLQHDVDPDGNVIVKVTLDDIVIEVMAGAKALQQLNVDIPDAALQILKQVCKLSSIQVIFIFIHTYICTPLCTYLVP